MEYVLEDELPQQITGLRKPSGTWVERAFCCYTNTSLYLFILWSVPEWKVTMMFLKTSAQEGYIFFPLQQGYLDFHFS